MASTLARVAILAVVLFPFLFATASQADDNIRIACSPRTFEVVPGEPLRLEVTIETDSAASLRLHVPADPLLHLRAVEKQPVERTRAGLIVHRRVVIWQALEPGVAKLTALSIETRGRKRILPEITITVHDPGP